MRNIMAFWPMAGGNPLNVGGTDLTHEFGITPLNGHRYWNVVHTLDGLALRSLHFEHVWDGPQQTALCHAHTYIQHEAPNLDCRCGFYAERGDYPLEDWAAMRLGAVSASGDVSMWGRIIQCELGYKAQHVKIVGVVTLDVQCQGGCDETPTRVAIPFMPGRRYEAYCDAHAEGAVVTVEAGIWLREAARQLSARYGVDVFSWADLERL